MSYILDALRKSEQQRQAIQPDTVTERITLHAQAHGQKTGKWMVLLILTNVAALSTVGWFFYKNNQEGIFRTPTASEAVNPQPRNLPPGSQIMKAERDRIDSENPSDPLFQKSSEAADPDGVVARMSLTKALVSKPFEDKQKPESMSVKKTVTLKKAKLPATPGEQKSKFKPIDPQTAQTALSEPLSPQDHRVAKPVIPALSNPPKMTINVFSYAEKPEDRFVIIDMVKYKTGQRVKGDIILKDIRSDSIVLQDPKGTFTVLRP